MKPNFEQSASMQKRANTLARVVYHLVVLRRRVNGKLVKSSRGARHITLGLRLNDPVDLEKALKLAEPLALASEVKNVIALRQMGLVIYQFELPPGLWQYFTRADLPDAHAVGLAEQRRPILFELDPPHCLIAGTTGAGKSETLKSILLSLAGTYTPAELGLILIDPHRELDNFNNEAHLIQPIATSAGEIQTALAYANQELSHRKSENIKDGKTLVVAIDEGAADEVLIAPGNLEAIRNISAQARKYQIHLILGTQKPTHGDLPGILDKLLNKFVGQLSDAGTSARVTGHAGLEAHKLTPKGDFLHIPGPDVRRFQVAMATRADYDKLERTEVRPVTVDTTDIPELPPELPERRPGRPQLEMSPDWLAFYFFHHPDKISHAQARRLGLTRPFHELHRDFCRQFITAYLKLRREAI